jgi:hypothetical protein
MPGKQGCGGTVLRHSSQHSAGETVGGSLQGCTCLKDGMGDIQTNEFWTLPEVELTNTSCLYDLTCFASLILGRGALSSGTMRKPREVHIEVHKEQRRHPINFIQQHRPSQQLHK